MSEADTWERSLEELNDTDPAVRRWAAEALGEGDARALYPLIKALKDPNTGVQDAARRSLIAIGGEVTAYMTLPLLREDAYLRNTSRIILKQIGSPATPLLRPLLKDKDDDIRIFALDLISEIRECGFPEDIAGLAARDPNANARAAAVRALSRLGRAEYWPALRDALHDEEWVCIAALEALADVGDHDAIPAIAELLASPSDMLRYAAIEALGKLGSASASDALLDNVAKATPLERAAIVKSLVQIGVTPEMGEAYDVLMEILREGDWEEKLVAMRGLCSLRDERAIPAILDVAGSLDPSEPDSEDLITAAMEGLTQFGCSPALVDAAASLEVKHFGKVIAIDVLAALGCREAMPVLVGLMDGDLREVRRASARALGEIDGEGATQQLRDAIDDRDGHVRRAAVMALGRLRDANAFGSLFEHLGCERYRDVYEETVKALLAIDECELCRHLAEMGPVAREVIGRFGRDETTLLDLSRDEDRGVRLAALAGLGKIPTGPAVARLIATLADEDPEVRRTAIIALGALGQGLDAVRPLLEDPDIWVRMSAATVLGLGGGGGEGGDEWDDNDPWR
jgi:HEAT repeat protein